MIELAKPAFDVGLFTNERDGVLAFWQQTVGVPFRELLPLGNGLQQHRHAVGDSVLKINHSLAPLPSAPASGMRRLLIGRPLDELAEHSDPDGSRVALVPLAEVPQLRLELTVSNVDAHRDFYGDVLGLPALDDDTFCAGASQLRLQHGEATRDPVQLAAGYRYITLQVFDVRGCHARILRKGGREGRAPVRLGDVAHISFVRDPDGNWIEISQRKSLTGSLD